MPRPLPATTARDTRTLRLQRALLRRTPFARTLVRVDHALYRGIRGLARDDRSDVVRRFSNLGEHGSGWLAIGATGAAVDTERRGEWQRAMGAVAAAYVANVALKSVVRRKRPRHHLPALVATPTALSFPSSHSTASFAAARAYSRIVPAAAPALYATATAMAVSRVYLGVHYPADVLVGAALGTVIGGALSS